MVFGNWNTLQTLLILLSCLSIGRLVRMKIEDLEGQKVSPLSNSQQEPESGTKEEDSPTKRSNLLQFETRAHRQEREKREMETAALNNIFSSPPDFYQNRNLGDETDSLSDEEFDTLMNHLEDEDGED